LTESPASLAYRSAGGPSLVERLVGSPARCRCGQRFSPGSRALELVGLSDAIAPMFRDHYYCSGSCARADFLETFETLEALVGSPAEAMVLDLRQTYAELGRAFAAMLT